MNTDNPKADKEQFNGSPNSGEELDHILVSIAKIMAFPTLVLLFCLMYLNSTWNRLDIGTLVYPYTILSLTLLLLGVVYVRESNSLRKTFSPRRDFSESVKRLLFEWKESIGIILVAVGYLFIMDIAGFFPSSLIAIAAIMYLGGVRNWPLIAAISLFTLMMVYILFVVVLGIRPPSGYVQIEFTSPW